MDFGIKYNWKTEIINHFNIDNLQSGEIKWKPFVIAWKFIFTTNKNVCIIILNAFVDLHFALSLPTPFVCTVCLITCLLLVLNTSELFKKNIAYLFLNLQSLFPSFPRRLLLLILLLWLKFIPYTHCTVHIYYHYNYKG